ncbi:hypothetical protein [Streptomyces sp. HB132]|uniref:hypothetical protein n=1 Tax=Streptomyces sp. HB132 TaxID=767388 RepID=UPI0019612F6F|nr:hypothetical protein [Streptomyces sp. HB132]MBM7440605.1 hypothetical protein [Streptomyces sp. HB132]
MEQRIDSKTKPEFAAGTDPAYIPGLTAPAPARTGAEAEKEAPEEPPEAEVVDAVAEEAAEEVVDDPTAAGAAPDGEALPDGGGAPDSARAREGQTPAEGADKKDGPVFEVSDRRGSISVDAEGVRFRLDDQQADFDWAEIGAVEVKTGRFGRRFTVTVHLSSRRWFNAEVEAGARSDLKTWTAELDEALDAYFEEA